jgi:hypothetical protein
MVEAPWVYARRQLRVISSTAFTTARNCYYEALRRGEGIENAKRYATEAARKVEDELWPRHLKDMEKQYGVAYGPWLVQSRKERRR